MPDVTRYLAVAAIAFFLGWTAQGWRVGARIADNAADQAEARAQSSETARAVERDLAQGFALRDRLLAERRKSDDEENDTLRAGVDSGAVRLYVRAVCPAAGLPGSAADPGGGAGTPAELDPAARPDYHALRAGLKKTEAVLAACQGKLADIQAKMGAK